jgi:peptidyl-prolyl cis-trans isomerase D
MATSKALEEATALFAKLQAGESGEAVATSQALQWHTHDGLLRDNREVERAIVQAAFRMPHPAEGGFSSEQLTLPGGDQALLALYAVRQGDAQVAEVTVRSDAEQSLARASANAAEQALIASLREQAEITIKQ